MGSESKLLLPLDIIRTEILRLIGEVVMEPVNDSIPNFSARVKAALKGKLNEFPLENTEFIKFRYVVSLVNIFNEFLNVKNSLVEVKALWCFVLKGVLNFGEVVCVKHFRVHIHVVI